MKVLIGTVAVIVALFTVAASAVLISRTGSQNSELSRQNAEITQLREEVTRDTAVIAGQTSELAGLRKPATQGHLGICFDESTDNSTGDLLYVTIASPADAGGVPSCPDGSFVSVVPQSVTP